MKPKLNFLVILSLSLIILQFMIIPSIAIDLRITSVSIQKTAIYPGDKISISVEAVSEAPLSAISFIFGGPTGEMPYSIPVARIVHPGESPTPLPDNKDSISTTYRISSSYPPGEYYIKDVKVMNEIYLTSEPWSESFRVTVLPPETTKTPTPQITTTRTTAPTPQTTTHIPTIIAPQTTVTIAPVTETTTIPTKNVGFGTIITIVGLGAVAILTIKRRL